MFAAARGHLGIVELLLKRDADPLEQTEDGLSALDFAMLGSNEFANFSAHRCQPEIVAASRREAPDLKPRGGWLERTVLRLKACGY
jgi:ankyrin repeat protein